MKPLPTCLVVSQDAVWVQRLRGLVSSQMALRQIDSADRLPALLERMSPAVVLVDLRTSAILDQLADVMKTWPDSVVMAFGTPGTDPMLEALQQGAYATEELDVGRQRLQSLVARALDHLQLLEDNRRLRAEIRTFEAPARADSAPHSDGADAALPRHFPGAWQRFDNVDSLVQSLVEDVASALMVSRVGIYCRERDSGAYRWRAGLRCLEDAREFEYSAGDPFVRWLALHAHVVSRANLEHVRDPSAQVLLRRALDQLGAELIVPLQSRETLLGWLFVGYRSTGLPFEEGHVENLIRITDCVSTTLDNALLYEENAIQKTLAETLLHAMPTGIVAVDRDGIVRWFNEAAQQILSTPPAEVLSRPIEHLDTRFADALRRALQQERGEDSMEWVDPRLQRSLVVRTLRLGRGPACLGAVALIQDVTLQRQLAEKQEHLERAVFWTDLAASMSHEIRNPLVAIKAFAQLLPERYSDPEFQNEFKDLVSKEIDRLSGIIDQIDAFAHPPKLDFRRVDLRACIRKSVEATVPQDPEHGILLKSLLPEQLPAVWGDERALTDCFAHVLRNAVEALAGKREQRAITIAAEAIRGEGRPTEVEVSFRDTGGGIPGDIVAKVFSPFCTTKARGLGLGLPIVKRTVVDHNGRLQLRSTERGTRVTFSLPAAADGQAHETHSDSG